MIGSIEVKVTAHSPQKPITPFFTFKDSPSSLRIIDVPKSIGDWKITEVRVVIEYPDGVTVARGATRNGNVWVATIEGTSTTGKVVKGCQILANGIDEEGQEVTGYVLGIGDVFVLERDSTISPSDDDEYYTVKYCEETPTNPQKGNLIIEDEIVKIWDGEEWFIVGGGDDKRDYADLTFAPLTMNNDPAHYGIESFDLYANGSLFTLSHFNIGNHTWYNENAGYSIVGLSKDYFAVYSSGVYQPIATFSRTSDSQTSWEFVYSGMTMTVSATPMTSTTIALANAVPWRTTELNNDAGFITSNAQIFQTIQNEISTLQDETLPLTAGSSHTITGDLYISAGRGCVVGDWAMLHEDNKLQFYNGDLGVGYYFPDTISVGQSEMTQIATTSYVDSQIGAVLSEQM